MLIGFLSIQMSIKNSKDVCGMAENYDITLAKISVSSYLNKHCMDKSIGGYEIDPNFWNDEKISTSADSTALSGNNFDTRMRKN